MAVSEDFAALAQKLETVDPSPQPVPARIYPDPDEAISLADFPAIILTLALGQENTIEASTREGALEYFNVSIYVLVGARATGLPELHQRCLPWARAIAKVLMSDLTLSGLVETIGNREDFGLFTYTVGPIKWAGDDYFGLKIILPVLDRFQALIG
jgi:hypothetical protein